MPVNAAPIWVNPLFRGGEGANRGRTSRRGQFRHQIFPFGNLDHRHELNCPAYRLAVSLSLWLQSHSERRQGAQTRTQRQHR